VRIASVFDHEGGWIDQPAARLRDITIRIKSMSGPSFVETTRN